MIIVQRWQWTSVLLAATMTACFAGAGVCQLYVNGKPCWSDAPCLVEPTEATGAETRRLDLSKQAKRARRATRAVKQRARRAVVAAAEHLSKPVAQVELKVAIQVGQNDKAVMELALNNIRNTIDYYKEKGQTVTVELVAFGPGLHMLRADTSPVKDRIAPMALENPTLSFVACGDTQLSQSKAEGKPIPLLSEAKVVPSGVVRLIELHEKGYAYIRP